MTININKELNEKQAKELLSSLKRLIKYTYNKFNKNKNNNNSLIIAFDNNEKFVISFVRTRIGLKYGYNYFDSYNNNLSTISLQQALNINKYSLDIINMLKDNKTDYYIEGYFTEQPLSDIKIFDYNNIGLEQKLKNEKAEINIENTLEER